MEHSKKAEHAHQRGTLSYKQFGEESVIQLFPWRLHNEAGRFNLVTPVRSTGNNVYQLPAAPNEGVEMRRNSQCYIRLRFTVK